MSRWSVTFGTDGSRFPMEVLEVHWGHHVGKQTYGHQGANGMRKTWVLGWFFYWNQMSLIKDIKCNGGLRWDDVSCIDLVSWKIMYIIGVVWCFFSPVLGSAPWKPKPCSGVDVGLPCLLLPLLQVWLCSCATHGTITCFTGDWCQGVLSCKMCWENCQVCQLHCSCFGIHPTFWNPLVLREISMPKDPKESNEFLLVRRITVSVISATDWILCRYQLVRGWELQDDHNHAIGRLRGQEYWLIYLDGSIQKGTCNSLLAGGCWWLKRS